MSGDSADCAVSATVRTDDEAPSSTLPAADGEPQTSAPSLSAAANQPRTQDQRGSFLQKQLHWTRTFKTLTRAIDDLYLACEMERERLRIIEAISLLQKSTADFQLLLESLTQSGSETCSPDSFASSPLQKISTACEHAHAASGALLVELPPSRRGTSDFESPILTETCSTMDTADFEAIGVEISPSTVSEEAVGWYLANSPNSGNEWTGASVESKHSHGAADTVTVGLLDADEWECDEPSFDMLPDEFSAAAGVCQTAEGGTSNGEGEGGVEEEGDRVGRAASDSALLSGEALVGHVTLGMRRRHSQLHKKLMSPERKKKTPQETKKMVDEKQARAERRRLRMESERVARMAKAEAGRQAAAQVEAERMRVLAQDIDKRHQRSAAHRLAHLDKVARKAADEVKKVKEVAFIQGLKAQDRMYCLQERLEDGSARRQEHLAAVRGRQRDAEAAKEQAQERRLQLAQERRERLEHKERKKAAAQAKMMEERRAEQAAREARAEQQRVAAEERAAAEVKEAQTRSERLEERLREADNRRLLHLEQIKERATLSKEERREAGFSPQPSPKTSYRGALTGTNASAAVAATGCGSNGDASSSDNVVVGALRSADGSITGATCESARRKGQRRRSRKLQRQLEEMGGVYSEPSQMEAHMSGYVGAERCAHWRCATAKLRRLLDSGEAAPLDSLIANLAAGRERLRAEGTPSDVRPKRSEGDPSAPSSRGNETLQPAIPLVELDLHAARVGGALECLLELCGTAPQPDWGKGMQLRMLRLSLDFLGPNASCEAVLVRNAGALCALVRRSLAALDVCTAARCRSPNTPTPTQPRSPPTRSCRSGTPPSSDIADGDILDDSGQQLELDEQLAAGLLHLIARIVGAAPHAADLQRRHATFVSFVISSGVIQALHSLFSLFDCPSPDALHVAPHVEAGLDLLHTLTIKGRDNVLRWPLENSTVSDSNAQALILALRESRLAGLPSLLTGVLLRASADGTLANAKAEALPKNFVAVAAAILRILANATLFDICAMQELLSAADMRMEAYHLVSFLLGYCTTHWGDAQIRDLLDSTLLLLGLFCLGRPDNQDVLQWGQSPNILQLLCALPFEYFAEPTHRRVLMPTLLSATFDSPSICQVLRTELSLEFLLQFLDGEMVDKGQRNDSRGEFDSNSCGDQDSSSTAAVGGFEVTQRFPQALWEPARQQLREQLRLECD